MMISKEDLSRALIEDMQEKNIDIERSLRILNAYNRGDYRNVKPVVVQDIPEVDNETIIDMTETYTLSLPVEAARNRWKEFLPEEEIGGYAEIRGQTAFFSKEALSRIGIRLYPFLSYGVLNGGSATSYADEKKNRSFNETLYRIYKEKIRAVAAVSKGRAKGLSPAYINADGSFGPSFLELKMRSLLINALRYRASGGTKADPVYPMFQMTSVYNTDEINEAYEAFRDAATLKDLIEETGLDICKVLTGVQPLQAALTHSEAGETKEIFSNAYGKENSVIALPGGHGQNFAVLKDIYRRLYKEGKRYVYLGNVDNLGFTADPASLAYLALSGKQAAFDFSFRTPVDVKGGILVRDDRGRLNCADIGVGISKEEVKEAEKSGKPILFNCATGLFDLQFLAEHIDEISAQLPMRISDQNKDAGRYSQAEQVTWEIIGMLDDFLIYGVDKYDRFLAAKLLVETLMTSGLYLDHPDFPRSDDPSRDLQTLAKQLNAGLEKKLQTVYGMKKEGERWLPKKPAELY
jgi:hypothetical protein